MNRTIDDVDGFELVVAPADEDWEDRWGAFMGPGYIIWANYPFFVYEGETYERAGPGGVIVRPHARETRYLVRETILQIDRSHSASRGTIEIIDKQAGEVIASRVVRRGQVENGTGWEGQHAAQFVRSVLRSPVPIGGPVGVKAYRPVTGTLESLGEEEVPPRKMLHGCAPAFEFGPGGRELRAASWRIRVQDYVDAVACIGDRVVVFSRPGNSRHTPVDVLSMEGRHLWAADVPIGYSGSLADWREMRVERVALDGDRLEFDFFLVPERTLPDAKGVRSERKRVVSHLEATRDPRTRFDYEPPPPDAHAQTPRD